MKNIDGMKWLMHRIRLRQPDSNEHLVGIAVDLTLSADASVAMDAWLNGFITTMFDNPKDVANRLMHFTEGNLLIYYAKGRNFDQGILDCLTLYLERYFEDDDPRPFMCDLQRSTSYFYVKEYVQEGEDQ